MRIYNPTTSSGGGSGETGATGATGSVGPSGSVNYLGLWDGGTVYSVGSVVSFEGSLWYCIQYAVAGAGPFGGYIGTYWTLFVDHGATGATGPTGPAGQSSSFFNYQAKLNNSFPPATTINNGHVKWSTPTQTDATQIAFSHIDNNGNDVDVFFALYKQGDIFIIQDQDNSNNYQKWQISATPTIGSDYIILPVTYIIGAGANTFADNHQVIFVVTSLGLQGATGIQGATGPVGATGPIQDISNLVPKSGATMDGRLIMAATTAQAKANIGGALSGVAAPASSIAGDVWISNQSKMTFSPFTGTAVTLAGLSQQNTFNQSQTIGSATALTGLVVSNTSTGRAATFAAASTAPAVAITQTGVGEAFRVEDETSPDATPFVISATGRVGIGAAPDALAALTVDAGGIKFSDNSTMVTAATVGATGATGIQGITGATGLTLTNIPANTQSSSYILASGDAGKYVNISNGGVTVPSGMFNSGDVISVYNNSSASQTITQGASVTMYLAGTATTGNRILAQRGVATILCVGTDTFVIVGGGLT